MRDPARIDKALNTIKYFWKQNPELRLGQMILSLGNEEDIFIMEDEELMTRLNQKYGEKQTTRYYAEE